MTPEEVKSVLKNQFKFKDQDLVKLEHFVNILLNYNKKYNLISKNTELIVWKRHILDSAQLFRFISTKKNLILGDFGSGAGFPGLIIAIYNKNKNFHVKLYEKSPVKRDFLKLIRKKLNLSYEVDKNVNESKIDADIIVSRAFKKLNEIINISREKLNKPHKIIILKGKNAQEEINNVSLAENYSYKIEKSITDSDSKIIILDVK
jgi:16S rRNA (guanine527-N7)-methyltransferase